MLTKTKAFRYLRKSWEVMPEPKVPHIEQSNTSVFYDEKLVLKLFRRVQPGINPDLEIGRFLTENTSFSHIPPVGGALEYTEKNSTPMTVAIIHGFVQNEGDAWQYTLDYLRHYYEQAAAKSAEIAGAPLTRDSLLSSLEEEPPDVAKELFGIYMEQAKLLGQRTAEFHLALSSAPGESNFTPEPFTSFYRQSQYQGMRSLTVQVLRTLRDRVRKLPEDLRDQAREVLDNEDLIIEKFRPIRDTAIKAKRIRIHGDYHLGQVLYTGKDFVIMDFEGEPARSLSERRNKTSAFRDIAGMLRSIHYASFAAMFTIDSSSTPLSMEDMEPWRKLWHKWSGVYFLKQYMEVSANAPFIPKTFEELELLLDAYTLEKTMYEIGYELNNRPDWVRIPLRGILEIIEREKPV